MDHRLLESLEQHDRKRKEKADKEMRRLEAEKRQIQSQKLFEKQQAELEGMRAQLAARAKVDLSFQENNYKNWRHLARLSTLH